MLVGVAINVILAVFYMLISRVEKFGFSMTARKRDLPTD